MDTNDHIFKPQYPFWKKFAVLGLPVIFIGLIVYGALTVSRLSILFWTGMLILAIIASLAPYFFIREVRFTQSVVVRRHFLPDRFLEADEIASIDAEAIHLSKGHIRLSGLQNVAELQARFQRWKSAKILKEAQNNHQAAAGSFPIRGSGSYAFMWGLFIGVIALFLQPTWLPLDPRWFFGIVFLIVYLIYLYGLPNKL
jgi:hypothetical protein